MDNSVIINNILPYFAEFYITFKKFSPLALNLVQNTKYSLPEILFLFLLLYFFLIEILFMYYKQDSVDKLYNAILILFCVLLAKVFLFFNITKIMVYLFSYTFIVTKKIIFQQIFILFFAIIVLICFNHYIRGDYILKFEHFFLYLCSNFGCLLLIASNHFFSIVLALEIISFSIYPLLIIKKNHITSLRASIIYFFTGILSTSLLLKGISLFSNVFMFFNFYRLQELCILIQQTSNFTLYNIWYLLVFFTLSSFFFKLGIAPFHVWSVKVYNYSPVIIVFFMMVVVKTAVFFTLVNIIYEPFVFVSFIVKPLLVSTSILSMCVGSIGLYTQTKFKKFMVYSSITHVGFLLSVLSLYEFETEIIFYEYFFVYLLSLCGIFLIIITVDKYTPSNKLEEKKEKYPLIYLSDFIYLQKKPLAFFLFIVCFCSLAGLPPFAGFFTKMMIFFYLIQYKAYFLAVIFIFTSIVSMYAYLRFISVTCFLRFSSSVLTLNNLFYKISILEIGIIFLIIFFLIFGFIFLLTMFTGINYSFIMGDLCSTWLDEMRVVVSDRL